jgi:uncharacterized protein
MKMIASILELEQVYGQTPALASIAKEIDHLIPEYQKLIELSPFVSLATIGPDGLDCSPRGDAKGFVRVLDSKTLAMPDRRGNNRIDSLRNIIADPRIALLFLIPGSGTTFRVNGTAALTTDQDLCQSFEVDGKLPRSVILITVQAAYFQCARAIMRSGLWDVAHHVEKSEVPSLGAILDGLSKGEINGESYDANWLARAKSTLW